MLSGNRLQHLALGGLVAAILVAGSLANSADVTQKPASEANQGQKAVQDQDATQPLFVPPQKQVSPAEIKTADDKADYYAKADLDAQERMATEAERLAKFTDTQVSIGVAQSVLLFLTLGAAVFAAWAAWKAAEAGDEIVTVTRDSAERQLRAYVTISGCGISDLKTTKGPIKATLTMKNVGQTPAYDVVHPSAIGIHSFPRTDFPAPPQDLPLSKQVLGPNGIAYKFHTYRVLTDEENDGITAGKMAIYVFGEVRYRDVFGNSHTTKYRYMIGGRVGLRGKHMAACDDGNEAN